jgi:hypothetical protein
MEKEQKQSKDPIFVSWKNVINRYAYHDVRLGRMSKRGEEVTRELEAANEEMLKKKRAQQMQQ